MNDYGMALIQGSRLGFGRFPWLWIIPIAVVWLLICIALVLLIVVLWRHLTSPSRRAREQLEMRYAKGEIDKAEFQNRMNEL